MSIIGSFFRWIIERNGRKLTVAEWPGELDRSGVTVEGRLRNCTGSEKDLDYGRHLTGIERWGQKRLRVFLGEELVLDEYDDYRPDADSDAAALLEAFAEARQKTIALAEALAAANIGDEMTVPHNDMGGLTVRGWLAYLDGHALRESGRITANSQQPTANK